MKNLIYKEFKLLMSPAFVAFPLITALLLVPAWPYSLVFLYSFFSVQMYFALIVTHKDAEFTSILPLPKYKNVDIKVLSVVFLQLIQVICAIPFAIISINLYKNGNLVSLDANFTLFGVALLGFSGFNLVFFPKFFKTGYKVGVPLLLGIFVNLLLVFGCETLIGLVPMLYKSLDGVTKSGLVWRILVLILGLTFYVFSAIISLVISRKNYLKVNI